MTLCTSLIGLIGTLFGIIFTGTVQYIINRQQQHLHFRLVALDKRLEAHQQAFVLWKKLVSAAHNEGHRHEIVLTCQQWWIDNCLYLDPEVRKAFVDCYSSVWSYDAHDSSLRDDKWKKITCLGGVIEVAVGLPSIGGHKDFSSDSM